MKTIDEKEKKLEEVLNELKNLETIKPHQLKELENLEKQKNQLEIEKKELEEKYKELHEEYSQLKEKLDKLSLNKEKVQFFRTDK